MNNPPTKLNGKANDLFEIKLIRDLSAGQLLPPENLARIRIIGFEAEDPHILAGFPDDLAQVRKRFHLDLTFHPPEGGDAIQFQTNASIEEVLPLESDKMALASNRLVKLRLSQFETNQWEHICNYCEELQDKTIKLFKDLKGY